MMNAVIASMLTLSAALSQAAETVTQPPYSWRGVDGSGVFPAGDLVDVFWDLPEGITLSEGELAGKHERLPEQARPGTRTNIVWRTLLPFWGFNTPVAMGNEVYLMTDEGWKDEAPQLICLSAIDGKILWQKPVDHLDAWPFDSAQGRAGREEARKLRAIDQQMWREFMGWWYKMHIDPLTDQSRKPDQQTWENLRAEAAKANWQFPAYEKADFKLDSNHYWRGRFWWKAWTGDPSLIRAHERCLKERIFTRPGWTSEGPYYGSTMGSVVGDGTYIYAITAFGGAACYDRDGKARWMVDLQFGATDKPWGTHYHIASPVLTDGHLVYYEYAGGRMHGVDAATGKVLWKVSSVPGQQSNPEGPGTIKGFQGHGLHMAPGGTPVVMRLGTDTVVVANHGLAVRVRDGKLLGQVRLDNEKKPYQSSYYSAVAHGDVIFCGGEFGPLEAIRLSIADDALVQEQVWNAGGGYDNRNVNLIYAHDRVYGGPLDTKKNVWFGALDASTGRLLQLGTGLGPKGYSTGLAVTADRIIAKDNGYYNASKLRQRFGVARMPDLKKAGWGYLVPPPMPEEVRARHIAHLGRAAGAEGDSGAWGHGGLAAWGNRIFIRNNDYLWCVGDPNAKWKPPESYLK